MFINGKALLNAILSLGEVIICLSIIAFIRALKDILETFQITLTEDEVFVFWNIFLASKHGDVTIDNVNEVIETAISVNSYEKLSEREIQKIIDRLIQLSMIKKENGNYSVTEKTIVHRLK